jgi:hypothetical protein
MTGVKKRFLSIRYPAYSIWHEDVIIHEWIMIGNHRLGFVQKGDVRDWRIYQRPLSLSIRSQTVTSRSFTHRQRSRSCPGIWLKLR